MYPGILEQQLFRFHPGKEDHIKTLLTQLTKQGRIRREADSSYFTSGTHFKTKDHSLIKAVWVLLDFLDRVEYHSASDFPVKIVFFAEGEEYEIICTMQGQEALVSQAVQRMKEGCSRRIVLVDSPEQISALDFPSIAGYCTVDKSGNVRYYQLRKGRYKMDLNAMQIRLHRVRELLHIMDAQIGSMETLDGKRFPEKFEAISTETALQAEKAACILRQILYDSGTIPKAAYLGKAASSQGVRIAFGDGILEVALPCLLPKKRGRYSNQFFLDPLNAALEQFNRALPIPRFRECSVCFVHVFQSVNASRKYFDYDNLQQKQILDVIALHAMVDDNSLLCDVHHTAEPGETDETKVFVMPKKRFPEWLSERQKA